MPSNEATDNLKELCLKQSVPNQKYVSANSNSNCNMKYPVTTVKRELWQSCRQKLAVQSALIKECLTRRALLGGGWKGKLCKQHIVVSTKKSQNLATQTTSSGHGQ
eukprot:TRINITY_DN62996_c0_g4_i1.p2 TRINITY_DN62996_c0_g4~~TRINITY_DN62996_c0_g4_i1.p2  ORF type:complete len:106 (-),score=0.54 TRINITY_DN62996_c0_g4_i1:117-434(-)